jgi:hypothetical protein
VSVLLGNGDGTFQSAVNFAVEPGPDWVAVADVNGDGRPDLVVTNDSTRGFVGVLLGNGNGTFGSAVNYPVGRYPRSVVVADVNGDGLPDLVTGNYRSNSVRVLLGKRNAATHFHVSAPASATAGTSFTITVTALTAGKQLDALYTGTVHFTSSDGSAVLPPDYTFTLADAGSHRFKVTLKTTGSQTVTATDTHTSSVTGQAVVTVNAMAPATPPPARGSGSGGSAVVDTAAATAFRMTATPSATAGTALDGFGNVVSGYPGTVAFRSWQGTAALPDPFPLVSTDERRHTFPTTATALQTTVTVHAAGRVRQLVDPEVDVLSPAGIEALFAQW